MPADRPALTETGAEAKRHYWLLGSLIVLFLLYPIMQELGRLSLWGFFLTVQLLFSVYGISGNRRTLWIALVLVTPAIAGELIHYSVVTLGTLSFSVVSIVIFLGYVIHVVFRSVLSAGSVTGGRIAGAISVYLLLGLLWSILYTIIAVVEPGSFTGIGATGAEIEEARHGFVYFSFVTLTTLGYGDVAPVAALPRTLAWMEAVTGQLFLAITIARLVGMHVAVSRGRAAREDL